MAAFDDGLALAEDGEVAVGAVPDPELLGGAQHSEELAVADEDAGLARSDEDVAVLALIHIDAGRSVQKVYVALLAVRYLKLLHLQLSRLLYLVLEPSILEEEILSLELLLGKHRTDQVSTSLTFAYRNTLQNKQHCDNNRVRKACVYQGCFIWYNKAFIVWFLKYYLFGMGSSQSQEQMEKFQRGYIKESRMGHPYFGNHFLLINRNQHEMVILKQLVFHSSSQYQQFQREYQKIERKPFSLIYPRLIVKSGGIQTCSNIYEINAYFDLVGRNLAQTIKAEGCFNQNQTWFLLNELSKSLQILGESNRPHWAISPENIYQNAYQNYFLYDTFFVIGFDPQSFLMNKLQNNGVMTDKMRMILEKGLTVSQTEGFEEDCYCLGFVLLFALTAIHPTSLPKDSLQRAQAVKNILVQRRGMISQELIQIILMLTERETLRRMDNYQLRRLLKDKQSEIIRKQQQEFEKSRKKEVTPREGQTKQGTPKPIHKQIVISDMHPINHQSINRIIMPLNPTQRAPVLTPLGTFSEQAMKHPQLNQASRGHISNFGDYPSDRSNTLTRINSNDRLIPKR